MPSNTYQGHVGNYRRANAIESAPDGHNQVSFEGSYAADGANRCRKIRRHHTTAFPCVEIQRTASLKKRTKRVPGTGRSPAASH
jgi:hypothetical protein